MYIYDLRIAIVTVLLLGFAQGNDAAPPEAEDKPGAPGKVAPPVPPPVVLRNFDEALAEATQPLPETAIPDDPPPHEGAMFELPYVIEAPDLVIIEVLEALPGRPIAGDHLVRPDGTISLGFYGDIHVLGLTRRQVKLKVIQQLRRFLSDEALGLIMYGGAPPDEAAERADEPVPPRAAQDPRGGTSAGNTGAAAPTARASVHTAAGGRVRAIDGGRSRRTARDNRGRRQPPAKRSDETAPAKTSPATGERGQAAAPLDAAMPAAIAPEDAAPPRTVRVDAEDSLAVFVDLSSYNSKFYYVQGDLATNGRYPCTGRETVLDAIHNSGGMMPTADPRNIRLIRPARGGKKERVYPIDLEAIVEKGDKTGNLQMFPGDRLVLGRDAVVKTTVAADRAAAAVYSPLVNMQRAAVLENALFPAAQSHVVARLQIGGLTVSLESGGNRPELTPAQREQAIKAWVDFWSKAAARAGGADGDDALLREALLRHLNPGPPAPAAAPK